MKKHRILVLFLTILFLAGTGLAQAKKTAGKKAEPQKTEKAAKKTDLMDINSATKQELMTLPGIGDAYSQKIIDGRPYRAKNQLVSKGIIPQATYDKISALIIARQNTGAPAKKDSGGTKKK